MHPWLRFRGLILLAGPMAALGAGVPSSRLLPEAEDWRAARRLIDLHQHVDSTPERLAQAVRILDRAGIGVAVNLSGGTVTRRDGGESEFARRRAIAERVAPGRFLLYFNLDYSGWDAPDFSERAAAQVDEAYRLGAAGFKEYKRLGLSLRDGNGELIKVDDPRLDAMWRRCGELGLPVSIHVADPKAFWGPFDSSNERWRELKDHRPWWFGDPAVYPPREELLSALDRVIARHPETTFVCVHFANNAEDLEWVEQALDRRPNMMADLAARVPEVGRHPPDKVRRLFLKHADRILFATDFQVYGKLILGSSGDDDHPTEDDAVAYFATHWRWLETMDRDFTHMTPIQGEWPISGIGLPAGVVRKVYFDNARRMLARSLPPPVLRARRVQGTGDPGLPGIDPVWQDAEPTWIDQNSGTGAVRAELSTEVRAIWTDRDLCLGFTVPFTRLTTFEPAQLNDERIGLWERDVVEAFIGSDADRIRRYAEFQVAPNGMKLDLKLELPERDFDWSSGFQTLVNVPRDARVRQGDGGEGKWPHWRAVMRIPLRSVAEELPRPGTRWRINLYRCDYANEAFLAWRPTLQKTFHVPERFGVLEFVE